MRALDPQRRCGWTIELDGQAVGELDQPVQDDMFWVSYRVQAPPDSPVWEDELWNHAHFTFRSKANGQRVTGAFAGGSPPFVRDGRITMRALYLPSGSRWKSLWAALFGRRRQTH